MKILQKLKVDWHDEISGCVFKECAEEIRKPTEILFQESQNQGRLPGIWKKADIVPVWKKNR